MSTTWSGLSEFKTALRQLPDDLAAEATGSVERATHATATALREVYPVRDTGNLRRGVKEAFNRSRAVVSGIVKSTAPHAVLWEFGTQVRATRQGWNRGRSPSHRHEGLIPIAQRERKKMNTALVDIVRRAGFDVSGEL